MRALLLISVGLSLCAGPVFAQDWQRIGRNQSFADGVDFTSIRPLGANRVGWFIRVYRQRTEWGDYTLSRVEANCATERYRTLALTAFNMNGSVSTSGEADASWQDVFPESAGKNIFDALCDEWSPNTPSTLNVLEFATAQRARLQ